MVLRRGHSRRHRVVTRPLAQEAIDSIPHSSCQAPPLLRSSCSWRWPISECHGHTRRKSSVGRHRFPLGGLGIWNHSRPSVFVSFPYFLGFRSGVVSSYTKTVASCQWSPLVGWVARHSPGVTGNRIAKRMERCKLQRGSPVRELPRRVCYRRKSFVPLGGGRR